MEKQETVIKGDGRQSQCRPQIMVATFGSDKAFHQFSSMIIGAERKTAGRVSAGSIEFRHIRAELDIRGYGFHAMLRLSESDPLPAGIKDSGALLVPIMDSNELILAFYEASAETYR